MKLQLASCTRLLFSHTCISRSHSPPFPQYWLCRDDSYLWWRSAKYTMDKWSTGLVCSLCISTPWTNERGIQKSLLSTTTCLPSALLYKQNTTIRCKWNIPHHSVPVIFSLAFSVSFLPVSSTPLPFSFSVSNQLFPSLDTLLPYLFLPACSCPTSGSTKSFSLCFVHDPSLHCHLLWCDFVRVTESPGMQDWSTLSFTFSVTPKNLLWDYKLLLNNSLVTMNLASYANQIDMWQLYFLQNWGHLRKAFMMVRVKPEISLFSLLCYIDLCSGLTHGWDQCGSCG